MKKINLVFAGQSNMMGACVFPPKTEIITKAGCEFTLRDGMRRAGYPCGEFLYIDKNMSDDTAAYRDNAFFCPAMCSYKSDTEEYPFATWSQNNFPHGVSLAPIIAMLLEKEGISVNYAHIAKGSTSITHYFSEAMLKALKHPPVNATASGAFDSFCHKTKAFFEASDAQLGNYFVWLQGESDAKHYSADGYCDALEILWQNIRPLGFDGFLCIRVGYFGNDGISNIMKGQELFCERNADAHMMTRACSFMPYAGRDESEWFLDTPDEKYQYCRDSFYGFSNQHINEKGFFTIARAFVPNLLRVLDGSSPVPEPENVRALL